MSRLVDDDHQMFQGVPRMLGFAAVAAMTEGTPHEFVPSTIRGYYLRSLQQGTWRLLPAPDVLLMRTPGNPLPGWSRDTVGLWLADRRA